jgi:hypothetical protein
MSGSGIYGFVEHSARTSVFPEFKSAIEFIFNPEPNPFAFRGLQPNLAQFLNIVIGVGKFETQELIYKLVRGSHTFSLVLKGTTVIGALRS